MTPGRAFLTAACAAWFPLAALAAVRLRRLRTLVRLRPPAPERWPRLSIVVAARNEVDAVAAALRSKLAADYPDLEVVFVDDRSTDGTGEAAERLAAEDTRLRVVRVDSLPGGWLGKVHALARGAERATGEWLLFSDADVHLEEDAPRRAVALCEAEGTDMLALLPEYTSASCTVGVLWTTFMRALILVLDPGAVRNPAKKAAIGSGAFNLVRREAFERTPGFEWLRMETGDDVALGMMMKASGARCEMIDGRGAASVALYRDWRGFLRGIEKNAGTTASHPYRFTLGMLLVQAFDHAPLAAMLVGPAWLRLLGVGAYAAVTAVSVAGLRRNTGRMLPGLLWETGSALFAFGMLRSTWLAHLRGGVLWRDTFYPLADIAARRRFEF